MPDMVNQNQYEESVAMQVNVEDGSKKEDNTLKGRSYHDVSYKALMKRASVFLEFLKLYCRLSWLDPATIRKTFLLNTEFEIHDVNRIYADIIYEVYLKDESIVYGAKGKGGNERINPPDFTDYFIFLLEFQSSIDFTMPFRLEEYMLEIRKRVFLKSQKEIRDLKDYRLPFVFPMVLFSHSQKNWTPNVIFKASTSEFCKYGENVVDFVYSVFNVNDLKKEDLMAMEGLLRLIFLLDQEIGRDMAELKDRYDYVLGEYGKLDSDEQVHLLNWMNVVIRIKYFNGDKNAMTDFFGRESRIMTIYTDFREEARAEGRAEGKAEGINEVLEYADYIIVTNFKELLSEEQIPARLSDHQLKIFNDYDKFKDKYKDYSPLRGGSASA
ncbi:MAG: Rpn family recombination-promoting nuclease/putative transposase [Clostridiales bacterium]|jgi:hypothetical protein|nr:Rpn family recombination-promoting nuclease/putative transposase [Clostridiales bacterium]